MPQCYSDHREQTYFTEENTEWTATQRDRKARTFVQMRSQRGKIHFTIRSIETRTSTPSRRECIEVSDEL